MRRRTFLKQTAVAAGAAAAVSHSGPLLLGMEDKAGTKNAVIGDGRIPLRMHPRLGRVAGQHSAGKRPTA